MHMHACMCVFLAEGLCMRTCVKVTVSKYG